MSALLLALLPVVLGQRQPRSTLGRESRITGDGAAGSGDEMITEQRIEESRAW